MDNIQDYAKAYHILLDKISEKEEEIKELKTTITHHATLIDRLQSFIPDRGDWRTVYRNREN